MRDDREMLAYAMSHIDDRMILAARRPHKKIRRWIPVAIAACLVVVIWQIYPYLRQVINTDLNGTFFMTHAVYQQMRDNEYGRIVNTSSTSARGNVGQANYAAAKAGLQGFTATLAKEGARKNITVNCIAPTATATEMIKTVPDNIRAAMEKNSPKGRLAMPSEMGEVICFLASERASYLSGQWIPVSAGSCGTL